MIEISTEPNGERARRECAPDAPFSILVIGDFSGREAHGLLQPLAGRTPVPIDRDNFDEVLASLRPGVRLRRHGGEAAEIVFSDLEHFHPDELQARYPELFLAPPPPAVSVASVAAYPAASVAPPRTGTSLLDDALAGSGPLPATAPRSGELQEFINLAMAPHLATKPTAEENQRAKQSQQVAAAAMRAILHHPAFQALEAAWRGLFFLVRRLETDEHLKVYVLDASQPELRESLESGALAALLSRGKWAVIANLYRFSRSSADLRLLDGLGTVAQTVGAAFLGEAAVPGEGEEDAEAWMNLRRSPHARNIGLVLPRFLLRYPYGDGGAGVEHAFEELDPDPLHEHFLWGSPALAGALLLGQAFEEQGWSMRPGVVQDIAQLPVYTYRSQGAPDVKPCAEVWMTEQAALLLLEEGIIPLASMKNRDSVRLVRFQSIAEPASRLAGRWESGGREV